MTLEEYVEDHRKRVANMTLAQARDLIAKTLSHSDMEIEFDKAVWMLLNCADEKINGGWIPVTEKRPVEFEKVLVTYRLHYDNSIHVGIGNIIANAVNGRYHWNINEQDYIGWDILAWMPLPEPYKGGQKDGNDD